MSSKKSTKLARIDGVTGSYNQVNWFPSKYTKNFYHSELLTTNQDNSQNQ